MAGKTAGLASARKMAKKGGTATLQIEISSDEEWETLLERKGLIVVDVFTEWCGPCVAMMSNLKKIKLEHGSDNLHLAVANADQVTRLSRFKGKSEPTWVFVAGGELLRVFFGSNAPALMKIIVAEIDKEVKVMEGNGERNAVPWDELTEEERKKNADLDAKRQVELDKIQAEEDLAKERVKRRNFERIARQLTNQTVVLFFPHAVTEPEEDGGTKRTCQAAYQLMVKYETAGFQIVDQMDRLMTEDDLKAVFYNSDFNLPDDVMTDMKTRKCIVSLLQEIVVQVSSPERKTPSFSHSSQLNQRKMNVIEETMSLLVFGDSKNPNNPSEDSVAYVYGKDVEGRERAPACWTPVEYLSKTAAMEILFPHKLAVLQVVLEQLPPPSYVIIFEASRAHEVLEVAEPFAEDVIHLAFFTTDNPETAEKICYTIHDLEKKGAEVVAEAKMVIALKKSNSDPMLTLASLAPLYVSPDLRTGTKEMELWFPPTIELVEQPNPWAPPPPPPPKYFKDSEDNLYVEEERPCPDGEVRLCRKLIKTADGADVEGSEWEPVVVETVTESPGKPSETTSKDVGNASSASQTEAIPEATAAAEQSETSEPSEDVGDSGVETPGEGDEPAAD